MSNLKMTAGMSSRFQKMVLSARSKRKGQKAHRPMERKARAEKYSLASSEHRLSSRTLVVQRTAWYTGDGHKMWMVPRCRRGGAIRLHAVGATA